MLSDITFSERSMTLLQARNLSEGNIEQFSSILSRAKQSGQSAKDFLKSLSQQEMHVVQKANSLADRIDVTSISAEGAHNLLTQPDNSGKVDLNNDGIVEVGAARSIIFPPVNAPEFVKKAYAEATEGKQGFDRLSLDIRMHVEIYGLHFNELPTKQPLSPEQQWSEQGIEGMFNNLYSNLDFRVGMEGWTNQNKNLKQFYNDFESALTGSVSKTHTNEEQPKSANNEVPADVHDHIKQLILDARLGVDRKKLEEIDAKIELIANNPNLSDEEKQQQIAALLKEKETIIEQAIEQTTEQEKRKALLSPTMQMTESLKEDKLKQQLV